ncbi:hypothetical protein [Desertivirga brevis]|uniref:hypothetical protein n=1 Tax=Desertivirga brevis TaxID=2810310 RepID=UPI001A97305C|nr:hypothetical protein [Pedobacter sp. SYSU D00873]
MKIIKNILYTTLIVPTLLSGCDVENPNITDEVYLTTPEVTKTWLNGLRRQFALTINQAVVSSELVSDNYFNNRTLSSKVFDIPQIDYFDLDVNNLQVAVHRLREMSEYGINTIVNSDASTTANDRAEILFINAYAHLLSGELFVSLPTARGAVAITPQEHFRMAITSLDQAIDLQTIANEKLVYNIVKARAYYDLGDAANATRFANEALSNKTLLKQVTFDGVNGVSNDFQTYIFSSTTNEFAPLPRLDYLDPKYYHVGTANQEQKPVSIAKAEEAYLIIAEAQISSGDLAAGKTTLKNMLDEVVSKRPTVSLDDKKETRNGGNRTDYALTAANLKFDPAAPVKSGYVLNRQAGNITAYTISGTKVTAQDIDNTTSQDDLMYILYLLRQEIFFAEGRRMTDLGIKFPVSQTEQLNNSNITSQDIKAQIPAFIPLNRGMDDFTYDRTSNLVTMKFDMNKILVQNKQAKEIFPFLN